LKFHNLGGFISGLIFPLLDCSDSRVDQQWMSAERFYRFHDAVGAICTASFTDPTMFIALQSRDIAAGF